MFTAAIAMTFARRHWRYFAIGGLLLGLVTYHRCAVSNARQEGKQIGRNDAYGEVGLQHDKKLEQLNQRELELDTENEAKEAALNDRALGLEREQRAFLERQADWNLGKQQSLGRYERRLQDASNEAAEVPRADLVPVWDALLAEHRRRDAAAGQRNDTGTQ